MKIVSERRLYCFILKQNVMKRKIFLTKKQILILTIFIIGIIALILILFINIKKTNEVSSTANVQNYIVTECFTENKDDTSDNYEVRYYTRNKKSYLVLVEKNGVKKEETVTEIKTEFTNEYADFSINNTTDSKVKDLSRYADDSGFIYTCTTNDVQDFLTNEVLDGKVRFTYSTSSYYECYIEKGEGKIMRGLFLYNSDMKTGTLLYSQCKEDISIPGVLDIVTAIESSEEQ